MQCSLCSMSAGILSKPVAFRSFTLQMEDLTSPNIIGELSELQSAFGKTLLLGF